MNWPNLVTFLVQTFWTALLVGYVGQMISAHWHIRKKRREVALETATRFWHAYGQFYAIWKLWNYSFEGGAEPTDECRTELLHRITSTENEMEPILLKLMVERSLASQEIEAIAKF